MTTKTDKKPRECGTCSMCCKALPTFELAKPPATPCPFQVQGQVGSCSCYDTRPQTCKDFSCLWLVTDLPEEFSPEKTHCIMYPIGCDRQVHPLGQIIVIREAVLGGISKSKRFAKWWQHQVYETGLIFMIIRLDQSYSIHYPNRHVDIGMLDAWEDDLKKYVDGESTGGTVRLRPF